MENEGTVEIFKRSVQRNKLRYIHFYGDGDTKSFSSVKHIYPGRTVTKFECIGHVQKRMGTRLRKLSKEVKGLTKNGKLNDAVTDKLQNYYEIAIRKNIGKDLPAMKKAVCL